MASHAGGTQVRSGYYVNAHTFEIVNVATDGGALPGGAAERFVHVPVIMAMLAAPALGGLFVVAFPLIGLGVLGYALYGLVRGGAREVAATVAGPAMPPGSVALTGRAPAKGAAGEPPAGPRAG